MSFFSHNAFSSKPAASPGVRGFVGCLWPGLRAGLSQDSGRHGSPTGLSG
ncbi:uncharacterized protein GLRG_01458 [Colletotrichum graminicola M1.001]|uniref:Uncharacterized protein n=1 Tax=Colletotrichum graminicola (strain M1.001 / M2 / FGSC 10212) TaxID=645133 RepID=E3Q666_COLGM|nr:uncharacterized protein GLRG_01458 [Colletotrichum graminicola M1.001]EFQ26314.1 hypothetical protein GLRG_01458 [Colletotrichum graminicola M1.001]